MAEEFTPESAQAYLDQAKSDPQLREQILNGSLNNGALDKWNRAQEIVFANPPKAPAPAPSPARGTAAQVRAFIDAKVRDPQFAMCPDADAELERLLQKERELTPVKPIVEPGVPQEASAYAYHAPLRTSPEAQADDQVLRTAALTAGLTTGDFRAISEASDAETVNLAGKTEAEKESIIDAFYMDLHRVFGEHYDEYMDAGLRLIKELEFKHTGTLATIQRLGLQYSKTLAVMLCQKGMLRYQGRG